ncbi:penicillin binding protein PBP4B [Litorilituus sediminis]|uniref:Penicillin binding protein PBP4B n=1 Tax=Litorilituus sediminis TaxID=718192 RepID=A0A4P6P0R8_9GAMM|nr:penicillin binding protein PBP4B [Litorilituus sediminis]QBG34424.1 penicillin binding protein PBP4B [Litorilituus sediminis]
MATKHISRLLVKFVVGLMVLTQSACSQLTIEQQLSDNYNQRIKFLVLHYTAGDYQESMQALTTQGHASAHYLIPALNDASYPENSLKVVQLVEEQHRAWHAGRSYWQGKESINDQSIGIELVNLANCQKREQEYGYSQQKICFYPDYQAEQISLLITLIKDILANNPDIKPTAIVGHSDIAPNRKTDPGPRFPWHQLYQAGIGAWYEQETVAKYWQRFNDKPPSVALIQQALLSYGYKIQVTGHYDAQTRAVIHAFQQHFIPWQISQRPDVKTAAVIFALLDKYFHQQLTHLLKLYEQAPATDVEGNKPVKKGQLSEVFPQREPSSRKLVNDRASFKGYAKRGEIIIDNVNANSADIFINGEKLLIAQPMNQHSRYRYSLKRRSQDGVNTVKVENVLPKGSEIRVTIPYPALKKADISKRYDFAMVDKLIQDDVANGFPGAVLMVVKDGEIIKHSAYGFNRKYHDSGEPLTRGVEMSPDTLFDLASNTKMFATNFALMKLISQGKLDINQAISHYLPEYVGEGRRYRTIKDMLSHRAGYAAQVKFHRKDNRLGEEFYSQDKELTEHLILTQVPFIAPRQSKRIYSDTDYMLLGLLVERITGMALDTYVETEIYQPLALENIAFNPLKKGWHKNQFAATEIHGNTRDGRVEFEQVRDYVLQGEVHDENAYHSFAGVAGHAGLFADAESLAVLAQVLLNQGGYNEVELFSPQVLAEFTKADDSNAAFALGWQRANQGENRWHFGPYASASAYGHTGWTGTATVIDPTHDLAIILLTNVRHSPIKGKGCHYQFEGKQFETGKYGSIISLVYEAVLKVN